MHMKKNSLILCLLFTFFQLAACTMDVSPPTGVASPSQVAAASPTDSSSTIENSTPASTQSIPITWADLNLTGSLVYSTVSIEDGFGAPRIQALDLSTGRVRTIFSTTDNGWIYYFCVSPDLQQLVMSYEPPSQTVPQHGTSLYSLAFTEGAVPEILFTPSSPSERYIQAEWSPDGKYLYFVHYDQNDETIAPLIPAYQISRMAYPGGQPEKILDHAFWPRVSPDSNKLVYVSIEPETGINKLFLSNADGGEPQEIRFSGAPEIIDAPIFSPDGASILFSAPVPEQAYEPGWWDRLLGVKIARAHDVPSDWWSVPISGGPATRLTHLQTIRLFASMSPDNKYLASTSGDGILVMGLDGSNVRQLFSDPALSSVVRWIP